MYDGDPSAFAELYDAYAPKIYRFIYFKVGTQAEAEDLASEVFLKTWEYVKRRERRIKNFRPFVYRLAHNAVIDHYRSRSQQPQTQIDEQLATFPAEIDLAADAVRSSDLEIVRRALLLIKEEYRDIILLRYIEEYSLAEIAEMLDKSNGAIRVTAHRAVEALKEAVTTLEARSTKV
ncbi:MAG: RNA polymerase sigma factor [Patescibacteria group bacterium]